MNSRTYFTGICSDSVSHLNLLYIFINSLILIISASWSITNFFFQTHSISEWMFHGRYLWRVLVDILNSLHSCTIEPNSRNFSLSNVPSTDLYIMNHSFALVLFDLFLTKYGWTLFLFPAITIIYWQNNIKYQGMFPVLFPARCLSIQIGIVRGIIPIRLSAFCGSEKVVKFDDDIPDEYESEKSDDDGPGRSSKDCCRIAECTVWKGVNGSGKSHDIGV